MCYKRSLVLTRAVAPNASYYQTSVRLFMALVFFCFAAVDGSAQLRNDYPFGGRAVNSYQRLAMQRVPFSALRQRPQREPGDAGKAGVRLSLWHPVTDCESKGQPFVDRLT